MAGGAPAPVAAFLTAAPKVGAMVALARLAGYTWLALLAVANSAVSLALLPTGAGPGLFWSRLALPSPPWARRRPPRWSRGSLAAIVSGIGAEPLLQWI